MHWHLNQKKTLLIRILFLLISIKTLSQKQSFIEIDWHANLISKKQYHDLKELCVDLIKPFKKDEERARAIFAWITHNIQYDYETLELIAAGKNLDPSIMDIHPPDPLFVFANKKALCYGFALIAKDMLANCGIKSEIVTGITKFYLADDGNKLVFDTLGHSWNIVLLNKKWEIIDFSAGNTKYADKYFMADTKWFYRNKYPDNLEYLLNTDTISKSDFLRLPYTNEKYSDYFLDTPPKIGEFETKDAMLEIPLLKTKPGYSIEVSLRNADSISIDLSKDPTYLELKEIRTNRNDKKIVVQLPANGNYFLSVGVKFKTKYKYFMSIENLLIFRVKFFKINSNN